MERLAVCLWYGYKNESRESQYLDFLAACDSLRQDLCYRNITSTTLRDPQRGIYFMFGVYKVRQCGDNFSLRTEHNELLPLSIDDLVKIASKNNFAVGYINRLEDVWQP